MPKNPPKARLEFRASDSTEAYRYGFAGRCLSCKVNIEATAVACSRDGVSYEPCVFPSLGFCPDCLLEIAAEYARFRGLKRVRIRVSYFNAEKPQTLKRKFLRV